MATELLLATRSADKLEEIRQILSDSARLTLRTLRDLGIPPAPMEDTIEAHDTFIANACAKAAYFAGLTGMPVLADDSGLCVAALGGGPGVRTRRFAIDNGYTGDDVDAANNRLLLEKLAAVADHARTAYYVCAAAFATPRALGIATLGTCSGRIAHELKGSGGFGYDPLFLLPDLGVTFGELTREEKHARSHRARAFRALAPQLR